MVPSEGKTMELTFLPLILVVISLLSKRILCSWHVMRPVDRAAFIVIIDNALQSQIQDMLRV